MQLLSLAQFAPTHRITEPWRFTVIRPDSLATFADFIDSYYERIKGTDSYVERKHKKALQKIDQSSHIVAVILHRDPQERVPQWEEIASVAMAVQNIWIAAQSFGVGLYWSTPATRLIAGDYLELAKNETCLGFLYMGLSPKSAAEQRMRKSPEHYVTWK